MKNGGGYISKVGSGGVFCSERLYLLNNSRKIVHLFVCFLLSRSI